MTVIEQFDATGIEPIGTALIDAAARG